MIHVQMYGHSRLGFLAQNGFHRTLSRGGSNISTMYFLVAVRESKESFTHRGVRGCMPPPPHEFSSQFWGFNSCSFTPRGHFDLTVCPQFAIKPCFGMRVYQNFEFLDAIPYSSFFSFS